MENLHQLAHYTSYRSLLALKWI